MGCSMNINELLWVICEFQSKADRPLDEILNIKEQGKKFSTELERYSSTLPALLWKVKK